MPMSPYVRDLRAKIGTTMIEVPTVSIVVLDKQQRLLLVRHIEGNDWTTPGGMVEPCETPADAAVREMWEETGLYVKLTRIIAVFGGPPFTVTYANGDRISWVSTVFAAEPISGSLKPDGHETLEVRYFDRAEINGIRCKGHVRLYLDAIYAKQHTTYFQPPAWRPDAV
jgi:ADP-ribose pyrophosphatase YjhB (NUDIX family)